MSFSVTVLENQMWLKPCYFVLLYLIAKWGSTMCFYVAGRAFLRAI